MEPGIDLYLFEKKKNSAKVGPKNIKKGSWGMGRRSWIPSSARLVGPAGPTCPPPKWCKRLKRRLAASTHCSQCPRKTGQIEGAQKKSEEVLLFFSSLHWSRQ